MGFLKFTCSTIKEKPGLVRTVSQKKIQSFSTLCEVKDSHPDNFIILQKVEDLYIYIHFKTAYNIKTMVSEQMLNIIHISDYSLNNIHWLLQHFISNNNGKSIFTSGKRVLREQGILCIAYFYFLYVYILKKTKRKNSCQ